MRKPIVFVQLRNDVSFEYLESVRTSLEEQLKDYHVLVANSLEPANSENIKMEVFHEKDFKEGDYESLKEIIQKAIQ